MRTYGPKKATSMLDVVSEKRSPLPHKIPEAMTQPENAALFYGGNIDTYHNSHQ